jgi:hypothetical protein
VIKSEELTGPQSLPADLKVILQNFKVREDDPLLAILAWHWHRINESRDILEDRTAKLTSALDERKGAIEEKVREIGALMQIRHDALKVWTDSLDEIFAGLQAVNQTLKTKPREIGEQIIKDLAHPIGQSVTLVQQLATESQKLMIDTNAVRQRLHRSHVVTAFLSGYATAALILSWIFFHISSH